MKTTISQTELKQAITTVSPAVAGKSPQPILTHILLAAGADSLTVAASNLDISITTRAAAKTEAHGSVCVPARLFSDVIGGLPQDNVTLALDASTRSLTVQCGRFTSNILGLDADDFPRIPGAVGEAVTLPADVLRGAIEQVAFAAATDESRPVLTGVLLRLRDNAATLAAADGFRLATRRLSIDAPDQADSIIPARALSELARIVGSAEYITMHVAPDGNSVAFQAGTTTLTTRLIDGTFPDYERIIPNKHTTRALIDVAAFRKAVKLASYFALQSQSIVKVAVADGVLALSANAAEIGDNTGEVEAMVHGDATEIALNVRYLADALAAVSTPQVALELQSAQNPAVLKPTGDDDYIQIVMPMSIR